MVRFRPRRRTWLILIIGSLLLALAALAWGRRQMRGSLAQLDGVQAVSSLTAAVTITRDALGVPTITGTNRRDVARATGFVHAQDRFFQMDLLRRRGAGELAELFGRAALPLDQEARRHGFRRTAVQVLTQANPADRDLLSAYTAGVNAGLAALAKTPWEYLALRLTPQLWREEDSVLCIYAMWFDLQDHEGSFELNREALRRTLGQGALDFLAPRGNSWDAALDGSVFAGAPLPKFGFKPNGTPPRSARLAPEPESRFVLGSNAFAVSGAHTATGAALLANDMHLGLAVPHIWYRAVLQWTDATGPHRLVGVTLPGTPIMTIGSNGHVAWGFTDAYADTTDVIVTETEAVAQTYYRTPQGWAEIQDRQEEIKVKGEKPVPFIARWTEWGPIIAGPKEGRYHVLRWTAHDAEATNLRLRDMETVRTTTEALAVAHQAGLPNENILIADADGQIAWTIIGRVPRRVGYDGRLPVSWAYGDRRWDGWLKPEEIPVITTQPQGHAAATLATEGILWSGNNRAVGGAAYAQLGDSGYDDGPRARQIRDDLRALLASGKKTTPADLHAVQLDDRAVFLERWQKFFNEVLTDAVIATNPALAQLRATVRQWEGHASIDSAAYRLVKNFRGHVAERALAPFTELAEASDTPFNYRNFMFEDALWQLVHEQPARLLNPAHASWSALLLAAANDVLADTQAAGLASADFTWGKRNRLAMQHPFSRILPAWIAQFLNLPAQPLPGDNDMPRVQSPRAGQSERLVVSPGRESEGIFTMPGGQSGHPLSPYYRAGHEAWARGDPTPLLPGPTQHTLILQP